jgi:hypothetical protein
MVAKGRYAFPVGEATNSVKLTASQVAAIKADGRMQYLIAAEYGVHQSQISRIKSSKRWAHLA